MKSSYQIGPVMINRSASFLLPFLFLFAFTGFNCGPGSSSKPQVPEEPEVKESKTGLASYYSRHSAGKITSTGAKFDDTQMMAAHPTYPIGTLVRVTNLEQGGMVEVHIADRGPSSENREEGVIIDLYRAAARKLGIVTDGRVKVQVDVLEWGQDEKAGDSTEKAGSDSAH